VSPPMALKLTREVGWLSLRQDVDWAPLLKETPQYKAFVVWDKARQIYAEPANVNSDKVARRVTLSSRSRSSFGPHRAGRV